MLAHANDIRAATAAAASFAYDKPLPLRFLFPSSLRPCTPTHPQLFKLAPCGSAPTPAPLREGWHRACSGRYRFNLGLQAHRLLAAMLVDAAALQQGPWPDPATPKLTPTAHRALSRANSTPFGACGAPAALSTEPTTRLVARITGPGACVRNVTYQGRALGVFNTAHLAAHAFHQPPALEAAALPITGILELDFINPAGRPRTRPYLPHAFPPIPCHPAMQPEDPLSAKAPTATSNGRATSPTRATSPPHRHSPLPSDTTPPSGPPPPSSRLIPSSHIIGANPSTPVPKGSYRTLPAPNLDAAATSTATAQPAPSVGPDTAAPTGISTDATALPQPQPFILSIALQPAREWRAPPLPARVRAAREVAARQAAAYETLFAAAVGAAGLLATDPRLAGWQHAVHARAVGEPGLLRATREAAPARGA